MIKRKNLVVVLLAAGCLVFGLAGCGDDSEPQAGTISGSAEIPAVPDNTAASEPQVETIGGSADTSVNAESPAASEPQAETIGGSVETPAGCIEASEVEAAAAATMLVESHELLMRERPIAVTSKGSWEMKYLTPTEAEAVKRLGVEGKAKWRIADGSDWSLDRAEWFDADLPLCASGDCESLEAEAEVMLRHTFYALRDRYSPDSPPLLEVVEEPRFTLEALESIPEKVTWMQTECLLTAKILESYHDNLTDNMNWRPPEVDTVWQGVLCGNEEILAYSLFVQDSNFDEKERRRNEVDAEFEEVRLYETISHDLSHELAAGVPRIIDPSDYPSLSFYSDYGNKRYLSELAETCARNFWWKGFVCLRSSLREGSCEKGEPANPRASFARDLEAHTMRDMHWLNWEEPLPCLPNICDEYYRW